MIDAYGRIPQAIIQGNLYDLGTYDQCVNLFQQIGDIKIQGKYCVGGLTIPLTDLKVTSILKPAIIQ